MQKQKLYKPTTFLLLLCFIYSCFRLECRILFCLCGFCFTTRTNRSARRFVQTSCAQKSRFLFYLYKKRVVFLFLVYLSIFLFGPQNIFLFRCRNFILLIIKDEPILTRYITRRCASMSLNNSKYLENNVCVCVAGYNSRDFFFNLKCPYV